MAKTTKLTTEFDIEVDGDPYVWRLHRLPQWSYDPSERHGKVIAARHKEGQREAMIEFPPGPKPKFSAPPLSPRRSPSASSPRPSPRPSRPAGSHCRAASRW